MLEFEGKTRFEYIIDKAFGLPNNAYVVVSELKSDHEETEDDTQELDKPYEPPEHLFKSTEMMIS